MESVSQMRPGKHPGEIFILQDDGDGFQFRSKSNAFSLGLGNHYVGTYGNLVKIKILFTDVKHLLQAKAIRA